MKNETIIKKLLSIKKLITKPKIESFLILEDELSNEIESLEDELNESEKELMEYEDFGLNKEGVEELKGEIEILKEENETLENRYTIKNKDGLNNQCKVEILQRLFDNLRLDELTELESRVKTKFSLPAFKAIGRQYDEYTQV